MKFLRLSLLFLFIIETNSVYAQVVVVRAQGEGDTFYAAQMEASRRAMMLVLPQLVSVDRLTINQDVTNTILSSVTGYIEKFDVIRESKNGGQVTIDANITISTQAIKQFNSLLMPDGGLLVSGSTIMSEFAREEAQSKFLNNYLSRSFRGVPNAAIDFKILKLERDDSWNSKINIYVEGKFRPEFLESVASSLKAINCSAIRDVKNCNLSLSVSKHSMGKSIFGQDKDKWDIRSIEMSSNPPNNYDMLRLLMHVLNYNQGFGKLIGRIVFKDSLNQYIQDSIDPRTLAGLEFEFRLPINYTCPSQFTCNIDISGKPFTVKIPFDPKSFGESFNRVSSMEISSYVNRSYANRSLLYNIICDDLVDYLQIHYKNDVELSTNSVPLPKGCKTGWYHDIERRITNTVQY